MHQLSSVQSLSRVRLFATPWIAAESRTWLSDFAFTFHFHALEREMATHSSVLAWRIPGMGEPGGLPSIGSHRVGDDWSDLAAATAVNVGNLISGTSAFSKSSLNIWKFMVHVLLKPGLENFEYYFACMWDECNCVVVWAFFGIAFLWDWNENWPFQVLWPLLSFPNLLAYWVPALSQHHLSGFERAQLEFHHLH